MPVIFINLQLKKYCWFQKHDLLLCEPASLSPERNSVVQTQSAAGSPEGRLVPGGGVLLPLREAPARRPVPRRPASGAPSSAAVPRPADRAWSPGARSGWGLSPEPGQQSSFQGASVMGSAALPWPPGSWSLGGSGAVRETRLQIPSLPAMRLGTRVPLCAARGDGGHTQHSSAHPVPVAPHLCRSTAISETANVP